MLYCWKKKSPEVEILKEWHSKKSLPKGMVWNLILDDRLAYFDIVSKLTLAGLYFRISLFPFLFLFKFGGVFDGSLR